MAAHNSTITVFHGTDIKSVKAILRKRELTGDLRNGFGPGVCTLFGRALSFAGRKCGLRVRCVGRILVLHVRSELMDVASPDTEEGAHTLDGLRALSLDDPHVLGVKTVPPREWDRWLVRERGRRGETGRYEDS
jgi:hypothetical protein